MSEFLSRITIQARDIERRIHPSTHPGYLLRMGPKVEALSLQEKQKYMALVNECRYDDCVILNSQPRLGLYLPPTGYVAVMHEETTFVMDMIDPHFLRGISVINLTRTRRFSDADITSTLSRMNMFIRDVSPLPYNGNDNDPWIMSLGPFGWMGIYEKRIGTPSFHLIIVTSMDDGVYEHFYKECATVAHGKLSVKETKHMIMDKYEQYHKENRARIGAFTTSFLEEGTVQSLTAPEPPPDDSHGTYDALPERIWEWLPVGDLVYIGQNGKGENVMNFHIDESLFVMSLDMRNLFLANF